jgi:hypothetical protein
MKRTVLLFMAFLVGILLPIQSVQSLNYPWRDSIREIVNEDHPWGGDITDPGGVRIRPGGDNGYIGMSLIGRFVGYSMPIILRLYSKRHVSPAPTAPSISNPTPANPTTSPTIHVSGGE